LTVDTRDAVRPGFYSGSVDASYTIEVDTLAPGC
jgi:hypothetical protein